MREKFRRWWPWLLAALLLLSLIPILSVGRYARAAADDYGYGIFTHQALQNGRGFLRAIWRTATGYYDSWQGTFSALALMSLTPCIWSEQAYWLTPVVMLLSLVGGTLRLSHTLCRRLAGGTGRQGLVVAIALLLPSVQCLSAPLHSFFWWNGAVYYTFTYGMFLLYVDCLVRLLLEERPCRVGIWLPGVVLGIFLGGSNYVSALLGALLAGLTLCYVLFGRRERLRPALALFLALAVPFVVSMAAPGNRVRQGYETAMPPLEAIGASIAQAWEDCLDWPNWLTLVCFLALIPLLWSLTGVRQRRFPLPVLFSLFTFLLFAAQNAPHFYAESIPGPERLRNIIYFSHYWLILINAFYWLGWVRRAILPHIKQYLPSEPAVGRLNAAWLAALALILLGWLPHYWPELTAVRCSAALTDGSAAAYARERDARIPILLDPEVTDPRFAPLEHRPDLLYLGDITEDPRNWHNNTVAVFYGKRSVALTVSSTKKIDRIRTPVRPVENLL